MNQLLAWMDKKTTKTDNESKKYKSKPSKLTKYGSDNRIFSSRVACRVNRSKLTSKWTKTSKSKKFEKYTKFKAQKSLTPSVNKISKLANFNPFLSPDQHTSKSSGLRGFKSSNVNTFLQRMDKFGINDKAHYLSKKSKLARDESSFSKKESRRSGNKSRLLSKVKSHKTSMTPASLKRMKKYISGSVINKHPKKSSKRNSKKPEEKSQKNESSLMFSKFLRSMEMAESPKLKTEGNAKSRERVKRQIKWLVQPNILGVLLNSGALLIQILDCMESGRDIYDHVKDYVEISQSPLFNKLEEEICKGRDSEYGENLCYNLKLERWVVLFFFYFSFNKDDEEKVRSVLNFLAKKICENFYSVMVSIRANGIQGFDLEEVKKEMNLLMVKGGFDTRSIEQNVEKIAARNLTEIKNLLKICSTYCDIGTKDKLNKCIENCATKKICPITEECLEAFYPFLAEKKVISVEIIESGKKKSKNKKKSKKGSIHKQKSNKSKIDEESSKEETESTKVDSKMKPASASTKIESVQPKKKIQKHQFSKSGTREFEEFIKQLESQESNVEDQLFFFQPELENEDAPRPEPPFLPKKKSKHDFTLVLDLDETLVHFEETEDSQQFLVRPYAQQFLAEMGKYYEVVIFTAAVQEYADWILERIDETKIISHRLYRQHTRPEQNVFIKDLSLLGRDVSKCIIIDNNAENFQKQPENGIFIKSWYGDLSDLALFKLTPILKQMSVGGYDDIRVTLRKLKEAMVKGIKRGSSMDKSKRNDENKENVRKN